MDQKEFLNRLNFCFKTNEKDNLLLTHENKFLRAQLLLDNVSENSYYLVHLLFEYLLDNTFHTGMNVQKNIFNSLHLYYFSVIGVSNLITKNA